MANIKLSFLGTDNSNSDNHELECYLNEDDDIYISISMERSDTSWICLDKSTAIKFSKTLRTEINKIGNE